MVTYWRSYEVKGPKLIGWGERRTRSRKRRRNSQLILTQQPIPVITPVPNPRDSEAYQALKNKYALLYKHKECLRKRGLRAQHAVKDLSQRLWKLLKYDPKEKDRYSNESRALMRGPKLTGCTGRGAGKEMKLCAKAFGITIKHVPSARIVRLVVKDAIRTWDLEFEVYVPVLVSCKHSYWNPW